MTVSVKTHALTGNPPDALALGGLPASGSSLQDFPIRRVALAQVDRDSVPVLQTVAQAQPGVNGGANQVQ